MAKIDFDPALFGTGIAPISADEPATPKARRWAVVSLALGGLAGGLFYIGSKHFAPAESADSSTGVVRMYAPDVAARRDPSSGVASAGTADVSSYSRRGDCEGNEIICTVATVNKPAEIIRKLVAAIPKNSAKQYKVRLSVAPIEEPAADSSADVASATR